MTPSLLIRPVLVLLAATTLSACGMLDSDPHRFENLAEKVAAIPLDGGTAAPVRTAAESGLRPAMATVGAEQPGLRVEVMDPYALWDARDAGLRGAVEQAAPKVIEAAAPAITHAVVRQVSERVSQGTAVLRPALAPARAERKPGAGHTLVQLGAYSSEASARAAWSRLKSGEASWALDGLTPVYEAVDVGGRRLVRLKVQAPAAGAAAVCAAARIDDPWCRRAA